MLFIECNGDENRIILTDGVLHLESRAGAGAERWMESPNLFSNRLKIR